MANFAKLLIVAFLFLNLIPAAFGAPVVDPTARVEATAAGVKADTANRTAVTANNTAVAAVNTANDAKRDAAAVGTTAAANLAAKEVDLRKAISSARRAAFVGDRKLESDMGSKVAAIQADIEDLKKRAQHECAAFASTETQKACLQGLEKAVAATTKVDQTKVEKAAEVELAKVAGEIKGTSDMFGHANQALDVIQAMQLGCTKKMAADSSTKDGIEHNESSWVCPEDNRPSPSLNYEIRNIGGVKGYHLVKITPVLTKKTSPWSKAAIVVGSTLVGGAIGTGVGYGVYPNYTMEGGHQVNHHWAGPIVGAAGGAGIAFLASTAWALISD